MIQDFMEGEGIELAAPEPLPSDPYTQSRHLPTHSYLTPSTYDKLSQFLEMDRHVLRFFCVWDDRDCMFGDMRPYVRLRPFFLTTPPSSAPYRSSIITWWTIQLRLERFMSRMTAEILSLCCSAVRDCRKIANPYLVSPTPHKYIAVFTHCACVCAANFPAGVMEVSEDEVKEWLSPKDLGIGQTINILGRKFLLLVPTIDTRLRHAVLTCVAYSVKV